MREWREAARYVVELRWHAPRSWGERRLPHGGRFYAWALLESPKRRIWTYTDATAVVGPGGVETTELAILTTDDDPNAPDLRPAEAFELSRTGIEGVTIAAEGRVIAKRADAST